MKEWLLHCSLRQADPLGDTLMELGALSVSVEDAQRDSDEETPLFGEPGMEIEVAAWRENILCSLWSDDVDQEALASEVLRQMPDLAPLQGQWRAVPDADWVRLTQSQFDPIHIGNRLCIVPSWHADYAAQLPQGTITLALDPGLAFGTGSHDTTRLCAQWLEQADLNGKSVLDYGCGSGILGIIAAKLGARAVTGVDIDPQAVLAAQDNSAKNDVDVQVGTPDDLPDASYDVVVANILSNPLRMLAPVLARRVRAGGYLVLSGILTPQAEELIQVYAPWIALQVWQDSEGWVCLVGQKTGEGV